VLGARSEEEVTVDERKELHRLIQRVGDDLAGLRLNTAIAALMGYVHGRTTLFDEAADVLPRLLAPFAPHLAEEMWSRLGRAYSVHQQPFPTADAALTAAEVRQVAVQVVGRTRGIVELAPDASEAQALAAAARLEAVRPHLSNAARVVYRPGRVLNLVVSAR